LIRPSATLSVLPVTIPIFTNTLAVAKRDSRSVNRPAKAEGPTDWYNRAIIAMTWRGMIANVLTLEPNSPVYVFSVCGVVVKCVRVCELPINHAV
jgi:hypothetical protein